jgi:hypothetical protein
MEGPEVASADVTDAELSAIAPEVLDEQERLSVQSENGLPQSPPPPDRTVTLGAVETAGAAVGSERGTAEEGPAEPSTPVYSDTAYGQAYEDASYWGGYWSSGYYWGPGRWEGGGAAEDRGTQRSAPQGVHIGQDWPSAPSYGPAFPFRSAPASPWAPAP